jgi:hypothetical protein
MKKAVENPVAGSVRHQANYASMILGKPQFSPYGFGT